MIVTLRWSECLQAADVGVRRRIRAIAKGREPEGGREDGDEWEDDIEAAAGEMAAAKALGVFWSDQGILDYHGDLLRGQQVRHTQHITGHLLVKKKDSADHKFYLVVGKMPTFNVVGWLFGAEAKQEQWWKTYKGRTSYWVPQSALRPLEVEASMTKEELV